MKCHQVHRFRKAILLFEGKTVRGIVLETMVEIEQQLNVFRPAGVRMVKDLNSKMAHGDLANSF